MAKTPEELQEYIYTYKSEALEEVNTSTQRLLDLGNSADMKLGIQLLTLSSLIFAIVSGFIINGDSIENDGIKVIVTLTVISLLISLGAGLKSLGDVSSFWASAGKRKHKEGRIILDDNSKSYEDLVELRAKLERYRGEGVSSSDVRARLTQIVSFIISICLIFVLVIIRIFSA